MAIITRTINPLPFGDLEPKRFEDLVRQLAYDFKPWRRLEATGKSGSDDGFDARGYEKVFNTDVPAFVKDAAQAAEEVNEVLADRLWLVQCKREKVIGPKKMRSYLGEIALDPTGSLHGIVFAAACEFSLSTRNDLASWCRDNGLSEWQIWGKSELEDMLFQPKNDGLLFAYFGISLTIRRRSIVNTKLQEIAVKRKLWSILDGSSNIPMLLRDVEDATYPFCDAGKAAHWKVREVLKLGTQGVWVALGRAPAWLSPDREQWDAALMAFDTELHLQDPWCKPDSANHVACVQQAEKQWKQFPPTERAWLHLTGVIPYQNIVAIDDIGDEHFEGTHIYIAHWSGGYVDVFADIRPMRDGLGERYVDSDTAEDRIEKFGLSLRPKNLKIMIGSNH